MTVPAIALTARRTPIAELRAASIRRLVSSRSRVSQVMSQGFGFTPGAVGMAEGVAAGMGVASS